MNSSKLRILCLRRIAGTQRHARSAPRAVDHLHTPGTVGRPAVGAAVPQVPQGVPRDDHQAASISRSHSPPVVLHSPFGALNLREIIIWWPWLSLDGTSMCGFEAKWRELLGTCHVVIIGFQPAGASRLIGALRTTGRKTEVYNCITYYIYSSLFCINYR